MRYLLFILFLLPGSLFAQSSRYTTASLLHSSDQLKDKNFYFLTVVEKDARVKKIIANDQSLSVYFTRKKQINSSISELLFNADTAQLLTCLVRLYSEHPAIFNNLIDHHLKPSGYYYRFDKQDDTSFYLNCWRETFKGINTILHHYGLNEGYRYKAVDSANYNLQNPENRDLTASVFSYLAERNQHSTLFYQPALALVLQLMKLNNRDEPARFEPLEKGENKPTFIKVKNTTWKRYAYSAILVPGEGLEENQRGVSPTGKMRCDMAVARYQKKLAPFIIVSGGFVHPFQTPYCEAYEMKNYLIAQYHVPTSAIIIEPHARHTTTNFRNAERLMIRYGFPINKPALCVTTKDQADYIENTAFDKRNIKEMGYVPYLDKKRLSDHELSFYPVMDCLQIDPIDPLDP